jgi:GT2 family glycosyltransferase
MAPPGLGVDIVVTVHDAAEATRRCLASVLNDPARPPGRVIVVDDASTDAALRAWLDGLAAQGRILLTRHGGVRGFTASANNGMALRAPGRDVVLLNSDTQVPVGWLDRLAGHAHASPWIGTVTPFSNNATICSYPAVLGASLPFDRTLAEVDAACRTANAGRRVDLPTAVGFCMYIRRDCLAATGPFDEATFGAGYGEENDFCLRAARLGWRHALACDTFVYHRGGASFGTAARALYTANNRILAARYRHYNRIVDDHVKQDAALPFRFAVTALLFRAAGPTLLGLGGTGTYGRNTLRMDETADALTLAVPFHAAHPVARLPTDQPEQVAAILRGFGVAAIRHADWTPPGPASRAVAAALGLEIGAGVAGYLGATVTPAGVMPLGGEPFSAGSAASPS